LGKATIESKNFRKTPLVFKVHLKNEFATAEITIVEALSPGKADCEKGSTGT